MFDVRTLAAQQAQTLKVERLLARLSTVLGTVALALASMGLYGILSYSVVRRTREIGVRMALGARSVDVTRLIMRELRVVLLGVVVGIGAALGVTRFLESLMYGLSTRDPITVVAATAVLLLVAVVAAYLPARRASSVDPIVALRFD
ncbi:MAG: FtsX-like permease family protein [Acidobacteria bacterium]|nr:FtsX-like permease family protein [Acidobacteriota bacterium]